MREQLKNKSLDRGSFRGRKNKTTRYREGKGWQTFPIKGPAGKYYKFEDHVISTETTSLLAGS